MMIPKTAVTRKWGLANCIIAILCSLFLPQIRAQELTGTFSSNAIKQLPPPPSLLDESCVVAILNRTTRVNHDGTWILPTVPANFGPVRARATCVRNGVSFFGQSDLFTIGSNQSVTLPSITLGNVSPIPTSISLTAPATMLTQVGQTTQLLAAATYAGGSTQNITAASTGTQYQVSNPAIATVSADGLVTAVSSGNVLIQAHNEGAQGIINIQVAIGGASNGGIPNSWILSNFCPNFSLGVPCPQLTDPAFPSEDPDHDGLTNLQEYQLGTDPNNPDTDGDGLTDGQEVLVYHTNPLLFSTDGSGIPDGIEVQTGTLGGSLAAKLAAALQSLELKPSSFLLAVNSLTAEASQQFTVIGHLTDGKTTIDLTSTQKGTGYSSSDLTICNFGAPDGNVFAGNVGTCVITVTNSGFTATASGTVAGFSPTPLGSVSIPGFANGVAVNGNYAFVAAGSAGLQVVNVTDRRNPAIVASLALAGNANSVRLVGNLAFVAAGTAGLHAVDVTNPLTPTLRGTLNTTGNALDVNVQGSVAYVANGTNLFLANVANPSAIMPISSLPLSGLIRGVSVDPQRGLAVVAAGTSGIYVVDVSNLGAPVLRGQLSTGDAHQVAIKGNFAYVADFGFSAYQFSVASVDISNPSAPVLVSSITDRRLGGILNDLVISGNLALTACVNFAPDGIPITDISDPTKIRPRAILYFPPQASQGMGIAVDGTFVYLTTDVSAYDKFGTSGNGRLYIGQYQVLQDTFGIPPTATIISPASGSNAVQGSELAVTVNATDDVAVAAVNLQVNGQTVLQDTVAPYVFHVMVPSGISSLTLGATAVDYGANVATAPNVVVNVIPDPGTTVIGRALDANMNPLAGFTASTEGRSAITSADGTFSILGAPTIFGGITVTVKGVAGGFVRAGSSATLAPAVGGTTNVGNIVAASRPLVVIGGTLGNVSAIDTSQNPLQLLAVQGPAGAAWDGVSVTPDGSEALISGGNVVRMFDLTKNPPTYAGDASLGFSSTNMTAITTDGRFALAPLNNQVVVIDIASQKIINSLPIPYDSSVAITPDNTTVIVSDNNSPDNYFKIYSLSFDGLLSDTGKTVPYNFGFWSPSIAMAPNGRFGLTANPDGNYVAILRIDAQRNVTLSSTTIPMCCNPWGIAITPDGTRAYVTVGQSNSVAVLNIDASDNVTDTGIRIPIANGIQSARTTVPAIQGVPGIAIAVDGRAYIANTVWNSSTQQGTITILDTNTNTVLGTLAVPGQASGIGVPR
jgi:DNA-binding beta-propeller fold protein YncE